MNATVRNRTNPDLTPGRVVVALALVALGALLLLQQAGYGIAGDIISGWWPAVIVVFGVAALAWSHTTGTGPVIVILVGLALLAGTLQLVPGGAFALFWPVILVAAGVSILLRRSGARSDIISDENHLNLAVAFGGITRASHAPQFASAQLSALFGGITLDLRGAMLDPDGASISALAAFGGVEIRVPPGWSVEMSGLPILGGYDSKALDDEIPALDAPRLRVDATAILGGVTVKH